MSDHDGREWNEREKRELREVADAIDSPPPSLKANVTGRLIDLGLLWPPKRARAIWAPWAAAAAVAVIGFFAGRYTTPEPHNGTPGRDRYILLLTGGASASAEENNARRREYGGWLLDLTRRGVAATGAELIGTRHEFGAARPAEPVVGSFIIDTNDESEALLMARANPHLRHGGGVVVAALR